MHKSSGDQSLAAVRAVYAETRGRAMSMSTVRLRWQQRHLKRVCGLHSQTGLARLKAIRDELRSRGGGLP